MVNCVDEGNLAREVALRISPCNEEWATVGRSFSAPRVTAQGISGNCRTGCFRAVNAECRQHWHLAINQAILRVREVVVARFFEKKV